MRDISGLIGVRNFGTADGGVTEGKALTTGEAVGEITEGANTEVGTISAGEVVGIITK